MYYSTKRFPCAFIDNVDPGYVVIKYTGKKREKEDSSCNPDFVADFQDRYKKIVGVVIRRYSLRTAKCSNEILSYNRSGEEYYFNFKKARSKYCYFLKNQH